MQDRSLKPCEALLQQWHVKREIAQYYFTALLRLRPDDPNALEQRKEISEKLFFARLALRQVADQLQSCQQEYNQNSER
jgi:hypothetical protein